MARFAANEIRQKVDLKAIEAIIQRFQSRQLYTWNDLDIRAVNALYEIGNITVEPLVKCLDNADVRVQVNAIYALGRIGDDRAVVPLIAHIAPANVDMRTRISDALIKIGRPAIADLIKLLDNNDRDIRWIAAYTLGGIGEDAEAGVAEGPAGPRRKVRRGHHLRAGHGGGQEFLRPAVRHLRQHRRTTASAPGRPSRWPAWHPAATMTSGRARPSTSSSTSWANSSSRTCC